MDIDHYVNDVLEDIEHMLTSSIDPKPKTSCDLCGDTILTVQFRLSADSDRSLGRLDFSPLKTIELCLDCLADMRDIVVASWSSWQDRFDHIAAEYRRVYGEGHHDD